MPNNAFKFLDNFPMLLPYVNFSTWLSEGRNTVKLEAVSKKNNKGCTYFSPLTMIIKLRDIPLKLINVFARDKRLVSVMASLGFEGWFIPRSHEMA